MSEAIDLNKVTLVTIGSTNIEQTRKAIDICTRRAGFHSTYFFTEKKNHCLQQNIRYIDIPPITTWREYQNFRIKAFPDIFLQLLETDYYLIIEWDGFIVNPRAWTEEFYQYDYIGAPFPFKMDICGNGGFSLRSKKFLKAQQKISATFDTSQWCPEDIFLSFVKRQQFINEGCVYAPKEMGYRFSTEAGDYKSNQSFGFHNFTLHPQFRNYF